MVLDRTPLAIEQTFGAWSAYRQVLPAGALECIVSNGKRTVYDR